MITTLPWLEKYFDHELSEAEIFEFNDRIKSDQLFKALVEQEKILIGTIRQEGLRKDLQFLKSVEGSLGQSKNNFQLPLANCMAYWLHGNYCFNSRCRIVDVFASGIIGGAFEAYFKPYANVFEPTVRSSNAPEQHHEQ